MSLEYLLVTYKENRNVLGNGASIGVTNQLLLLPPGDYTIALDGGPCCPAELPIALNGTSPISPLAIAFS